jgi:hypothetical protein
MVTYGHAELTMKEIKNTGTSSWTWIKHIEVRSTFRRNILPPSSGDYQDRTCGSEKRVGPLHGKAKGNLTIQSCGGEKEEGQ